MSKENIEQEEVKILPDEIILEIVSLLPAKSIGRFRCTSKPWRSLLSQPHFIKTHLNRTKHHHSPQQSLLLLHDRSSKSLHSTQLNNAHHLFDEITLFAKQLTFDDHIINNFWQLASCDGLFLVSDYEDTDIFKLLLFNPTTREIKEIHSNSSLPSDHELVGDYGKQWKLQRKMDSVNNSTKLVSIGLGYDSVSDDYKAVMISCYKEYDFDPVSVDYKRVMRNPHNDSISVNVFSVNVYSVKNGTWKRIEDSPYNHVRSFASCGIFLNGYIHWAVYDNYGYPTIVAFDLVTETFHDVPRLRLVDESDENYDEDKIREYGAPEFPDYRFDDLAELGGCLCAFTTNISDTCHRLYVAIMKEYDVKESWCKIRVTFDDSQIVPICLLTEEQMVMRITGNAGDVLVVYNLKEGTLKDIIVHGTTGQINEAMRYIQTLVSPHCRNEAV